MAAGSKRPTTGIPPLGTPRLGVGLSLPQAPLQYLGEPAPLNRLANIESVLPSPAPDRKTNKLLPAASRPGPTATSIPVPIVTRPPGTAAGNLPAAGRPVTSGATSLPAMSRSDSPTGRGLPQTKSPRGPDPTGFSPSGSSGPVLRALRDILTTLRGPGLPSVTRRPAPDVDGTDRLNFQWPGHPTTQRRLYRTQQQDPD
jgi:hypothetical protein